MALPPNRTKQGDFVEEARRLLVERQYGEAARVCRRGLIVEPSRGEGRLLLGEALLGAGRVDEALAEMRVLLDGDERSARGYYLRGEALALKGDYAQAEAALERSVALDATDSAAVAALAEVRTALAAGLGEGWAEPVETREYPARLLRTMPTQTTEPGTPPHAAVLAAEAIGGDVSDTVGHSFLDDGDVDPTVHDAPPRRATHATQATGEAAQRRGARQEPPFRGTLVAKARRDVRALEAQRGHVPTGDEPIHPDELRGAPARGHELRADELPTDELHAGELDDDQLDDDQLHTDQLHTDELPTDELDDADPTTSSFPRAEPSAPVARPARREADELPTASFNRAGSEVAATSHFPRAPQELPTSGFDRRGADVAPTSHFPRALPEGPTTGFARAAIAPPSSENARTNDFPRTPAERAPATTEPRRDVLAKPGPTSQLGFDPPTLDINLFEINAADPDAPDDLDLDEPAPEDDEAEELSDDDVEVAPRERVTRSEPATSALPPEVGFGGPEESSDERATPGHARSTPTPSSVTGAGRLLGSSRAVVLLGGGALTLLVVVALITGTLLREWRLRGRVARRWEVARERLAEGTAAGYAQAAEEYRRILVERPGSEAAKEARARTLAEASLEFGESIEEAARETSALGDDAAEDAEIARACVALVRGDLPRARRIVEAARVRYPSDARLVYLAGRVALVEGRSSDAGRLIAEAAARAPEDALVLHGLGLAEARGGNTVAAMSAFAKALEVAPRQPATLVDRGALDVWRARATLRSAAAHPAGVAAAGAAGSTRGGARGASATGNGAASVAQSLLAEAETGFIEVTGPQVAAASALERARAYLWLGEVKLLGGHAQAARSLLTRAEEQLSDGDSRLALQLAEAFARAGEWERAERWARRALGAPSSEAVAHLVLSAAARARGEPRAARAEVARGSATVADTHAERARVLAALGDGRGARAALDTAIALAPDRLDLAAERAVVALAATETPAVADARASLVELDRLERAHPGSGDVAWATGQALIAAGEVERAKGWLTRALERDPACFGARVALAQIHRAEGHTDTALAELKQVLDEEPRFAAALAEEGAIALAQRDGATAKGAFEVLAATQPGNAAALLGAARARVLLGDLAGAAESLGRAQRLAGGGRDGGGAGISDEDVAFVRASLALGQRRTGEALAIVERALPTARTVDTALLFLRVNAAAGRPLDDARLVARLPALLRVASEVVLARADDLITAGKPQRAAALAAPFAARPSGRAASARRGPTLSPTLRSLAMMVLGHASWATRQYPAARRALAEAERLDPRNALAVLYEGVVLADEGATDPAIAAFERATTLDATLAAAWCELARARQARAAGDLADARTAWETCLTLAPLGPHAELARAALAGTPPPPRALRPAAPPPRKPTGARHRWR